MYILYISRSCKHFALKFLSCLNEGCGGDDDDDDDDDDELGFRIFNLQSDIEDIKHHWKAS